jgi:2-pyrone-4,6-dicarboxylate lactonase
MTQTISHWRVPDEAWDSHVHIFSRPPDAVIGGRAFALPHAPMEALLAMHHSLQISRAVLIQVGHLGAPVDGLLKQLEQGQGRYSGVARLSKNVSDADIAMLHRHGVRGCRFYWVDFLNEHTPVDEFRAVVERIAKYGWHVLLHVQGKDLLAHEKLFRECPVPIVIDHLAHLGPGQELLEAAMELILDLQRTRETYVKLASNDRWSKRGAPDYADLIPLYRRVIDNDVTRVLWATDWPHVLYKNPSNPIDPPPDDRDLLALLLNTCRTQTEVDTILRDTPARLYA